jgi:hypothetical protein
MEEVFPAGAAEESMRASVMFQQLSTKALCPLVDGIRFHATSRWLFRLCDEIDVVNGRVA